MRELDRLLDGVRETVGVRDTEGVREGVRETDGVREGVRETVGRELDERLETELEDGRGVVYRGLEEEDDERLVEGERDGLRDGETARGALPVEVR